MRLRTFIRTAAIAAVGLSLSACVNYQPQFDQLNTRLDQVDANVASLDARVQDAIVRADAAGQTANAAAAEARAANQRVDQMNMQRMAPRSPRG